MSEIKTNKISSLDSSNSDITLDPDGTGDVVVAAGHKLGIGTTSPSKVLDVRDNDATGTTTSSNRVALFATNGTGKDAHITFSNLVDSPASIGNRGALYFDYNNAERMRIDSSGNVLVGKSDTSINTQGVLFNPNFSHMSSTSDTALALNRKTSDGAILNFRKDGTTVGNISCSNSGTYIYFGSSAESVGLGYGGGFVFPTNGEVSGSDNAKDLGSPSFRWDDIYATNSTIQTSDQNEKEQIASLTSAEMTAAKAISKLFKTFKWQDKVAAKGDAARRHAGVIAQEVQTAMTNAGLDAADYAFWCSDTWWEADEAYTDDDGNAQTRTVTYDTQADAPAGATQRTRLGIRYPELLAFVGAATEQRLADIETRLTALENA